MKQFTPPPMPPLPENVRLEYAKYSERRVGNGLAVASLVLGILGCVPFITGLLAIVFGILGIRKTQDPRVNGKGLAVAGLVLGIVGVLAWIGFAGILAYSYRESKPAGVIAKQFLQDLSSGNIKAAMADSTGFAEDQLRDQSQQLGQFGTLQSVSLTSFYMSTTSKGFTRMELGGTATFSNGLRRCQFFLTRFGDSYTVTSYRVQ